MKKWQIAVLVIAIIVILIGGIIFDLLIPREKPLKEVEYKDGGTSAYSVIEGDNELTVILYRNFPLRTEDKYFYSPTTKTIVEHTETRYYANKLEAIFYYFTDKDRYEDAKVSNNVLYLNYYVSEDDNATIESGLQMVKGLYEDNNVPKIEINN